MYQCCSKPDNLNSQAQLKDAKRRRGCTVFWVFIVTVMLLRIEINRFLILESGKIPPFVELRLRLIALDVRFVCV